MGPVPGQLAAMQAQMAGLQLGAAHQPMQATFQGLQQQSQQHPATNLVLGGNLWQ